MFEKLIEAVLAEYVSEWIEGIDVDNMKIGIFSGKVEFHDLKLNVRALDKLQFPMQIIQASVGSLKIKVPWKRLRERAVKIVMEDIFILAEPSHGGESSSLEKQQEISEKYEARRRWAKQQEIRVREILEKTKNDGTTALLNTNGGTHNNTADATANWGFRDKIMHNVIDNVSLELRNIHFRFEDINAAISSGAMAFGCVVESVVVQTTNANGHVTFVDRAQSHTPFLHKCLEVKSGAIYCINGMSVPELLATRNAKLISPMSTSDHYHGHHIFHPIHLTIKLTINHDETTYFTIPRFQFSTEIGSIRASLSPSQCNDLVCLVNFVSAHEIFLKRIHIRRKRPQGGAKGHAKLWWQYAFFGAGIFYSLPSHSKSTIGLDLGNASVLGTTHRKCTWKLFIKLWFARKQYIALQKKVFRAAMGKSVPETIMCIRNQLLDLEDELDVETIVFFRLCSREEFRLEDSRQNSGKKISNWRSKWKGHGKTDSSKESVDIDFDYRSQMDLNERIAIYITVADHMIRASTKHPSMIAKREDLLFTMDALVSSMTLSLVSVLDQKTPTLANNTREFIRLEFSELVIAHLQRRDAYRVTFNIHRSQIIEYIPRTETIQEVPLKNTSRVVQPLMYALPAEDDKDEAKTLFKLAIESSQSKLILSFSMRPIRMIYNMNVIRRLESYFSAHVKQAVPILKENASEVLTLSSSWMKNTIIKAQPAQHESLARTVSDKSTVRRLEFSVNLSRIEVLVLSNMVSPIVEMCFYDLHIYNKDIPDNFVFSIKTVQMFFMSSLHTAMSPSKFTIHKEENENDLWSVTNRLLSIDKRSRSVVLKKTKFLLELAVIRQLHRSLKYFVTCNLPPIFLALSREQYYQILQASNSWKDSSQSCESHSNSTSESSLKKERAISSGIGAQHKQPNATKTACETAEENICIKVVIPDIYVVLEGVFLAHNAKIVNLLFQIQHINLEIKGASLPTSVHLRFEHFLICKQVVTEAIQTSQVAKRSKHKPSLVRAFMENLQDMKYEDHPGGTKQESSDSSQEITSMLIEVEQASILVNSTLSPIKIMLRVNRVIGHWDHMLVFDFFQSYLCQSDCANDIPSIRNTDTNSLTKRKPLEYLLGKIILNIDIAECLLNLQPAGDTLQKLSFRLSVCDIHGMITRDSVDCMIAEFNIDNSLILESYHHVIDKHNQVLDIARPESSTTCAAIDHETYTLIQVDKTVAKMQYHAPAHPIDNISDLRNHINMSASNLRVHYIHGHICTLFDHLHEQVVIFDNATTSHSSPRTSNIDDNNVQVGISIHQIEIDIPRGALSSAFERKRKPEKLQIDVAHAHLSSERNCRMANKQQYRLELSDIDILSYVPVLNRPHTDAVASFDEAIDTTREITQPSVQANRLLKLPKICSSFSSDQEEHVNNQVLSELQQTCKDVFQLQIRVATSPSELDSMHHNEDSLVEHNSNIEQHEADPIVICLDDAQIQLFVCLVEENFSVVSLLPSQISTTDDFLTHNVEIVFGDFCFRLLEPYSSHLGDVSNIDGRRRVISEFDFADVKLKLHGYSTLRQEYQLTCSNSQIWLLASLTDDVGADGLEKMLTKTRCSQDDEEMAFLLCADIFIAKSESENIFDALSLTLNTGVPNPSECSSSLEIKTHISAVAITPMFLSFITALLPVLNQTEFLFREIIPTSPINFSMTTGIMHIILSRHIKSQAGAFPTRRSSEIIANQIDKREDSDNDSEEEEDQALHLIISGCFIVRFCTSATSCSNVQIFGRKVSMEISRQWPPHERNDDLGHLSSSKQEDTSDESLPDTARLLCQDITLDVDVTNQSSPAPLFKVSVALTNVNVIVCHLDLLMLVLAANIFKTKYLKQHTSLDRQLTHTSSPALSFIIAIDNASFSYVCDIGEYFIPMVRCYISKINMVLECIHQDAEIFTHSSPGIEKGDAMGSAGTIKSSKETLAATSIKLFLYFTDSLEGFHELEEEEGMSIWGFNSVLGAWEPIMEPWMFSLALHISINDPYEKPELKPQAGKITVSINFDGSELHPLNINFSPFLLDTMCKILKKIQQFKQSAEHLASTQKIEDTHIPTASVISSGFYFENDCGIPITFFLGNGNSQEGYLGRSRVLSYERESRHSSFAKEVLLPGKKVPLKLPTAMHPTKTRDHAFTFSLGEDESWLPMTNVNVQSVGSYVYTLLPTQVKTMTSPENTERSLVKLSVKPIQVLLEISTTLGYRNIIVSSTARVYNDTDSPLSFGVIVDRTNPVLDIGVIEPHGFRGIPVTLFTSTSDAIRLVTRPYSASNQDTEKHRWSNEIFLSSKSKMILESSITSPLMLSDYTCQCQRILDGTKPLHQSQSCKANGFYLKYITQTFPALSPGSDNHFTSIRLQAPVSFENKCSVTIYVVVFVYKKLKASTGQDRGCFHLVSSEKVGPHRKLNLTDSSLTEETFCSISITGDSWSKLFLLSTELDHPNASSAFTAAANFLSSPLSRLQNTTNEKQQPSGLSTRASAPTTATIPTSHSKQTLCTVQDFFMRAATLNVIQPIRSPGSITTQKVIIQPRFVIRNETVALPLRFEPCDINRMKSPQAAVGVAVKSMYNLATSTFGMQNRITSKPKTVEDTDHHQNIKFCDTPRLEFLHAKLNAFKNPQRSTRDVGMEKRMSISGWTREMEAHNAASLKDDLNSDQEASNTHSSAYYVSSTNLLNVGMENSLRASQFSNSQVNMEAALGGFSKSLRVLDEMNQQWKDLTVRLEQVDTWGMTNVTFYERYIFANHTDHELLCCSSQGIRSGRQDIPSFFSLADTPNQAACTGTLIPCHSCTPFHWNSSAIPTDFCVRLLKLSEANGLKSLDSSPETWRWSGQFSLHDIGEAAIKLTSLNSNKVHVIRVEVRAEDSGQVSVLLTSEESDQYPLYRIINSVNDVTLYIQQKFAGGAGELSPATEDGRRTICEYNRGVRQTLASGDSLCFGWDEAYFLHPLERKILLSFSAIPVPDLQLEIAIDHPNQTHSFTLPPRGPNERSTFVYVYWYLNGVTKTIHIHNTHLENEQLTGKQIARLFPLASHLLHATEQDSKTSAASSMLSSLSHLTIQLQIPHTTLSFISSKAEEVLLATIEKLSVNFTRHFDDNDQLEIKMALIQLDNQLENAVLPVLLTPSPTDTPASYYTQTSHQAHSNNPIDASSLSRTSLKVEKEAPFFHFSLLKLSYGEEVDYIKYLALMFQPIQIQADDYLLLSLAAIVTETIEVLHRNFPSLSSASSLPTTASAREAEVLLQQKQNRRMYIESMQLHPIKLQITFQQNNLADAISAGTVATTVLENRAAAIVVLPVLFLILRANLVNIDAALLHLNALHIDHSFSSLRFMISTIKRHYSFQALLQMYAFIGSADILGNPIGLVTNLGTGVRDFFYEPAVGMVKSPQDFLVGLSRGTASLVKNSIYGTFNAASLFTGTLSSGIASLSMDRNYISERNSRLRREVATHVGTGLLYGTKQLGHGIFDGVSGVLTAPVLGAYSNGLGGFVEGLGKGLIGVAVKPTAGILDLASRTTAGITATATVFDKKARSTRIRLPRMMHRSDQRLRIYSIEEAFVASILQRLLHTKRSGFETEEIYRAHVLLPMNRMFVVTTLYCLYIEWNTGNLLTGLTLSGGLTFRLVWKHQVDTLDRAEFNAKGVQVVFQSSSGAKPASSTTVNTGPTKILIPFRSEDRLYADRLIKCVTNVAVGRVQS